MSKKAKQEIRGNDLIESFSGIRGVYGQSITRDFAYRYVFYYCQFLGKQIKSLAIAGDSRPSTPALKEAMIRAFSDFGVKKIIDFGVVPIQVCEYGILKNKVDGGIYITASHNEPEYNGWKILKEDGALLYPKQIDELIKIVHDARVDAKLQKIYETTKIRNTKNAKDAKLRKCEKCDVVNKNREAVDNYVDFVLRRIGAEAVGKIKKAGLKILIDPNGGAAIETLELLLKKISVSVKIINNKIGEFKRLIEPNIESLAYLTSMMRENDFEFACGFDCDADRVELVLPENSSFVREMGAMVSGNYVLALACDEFLSGTKGEIVVTNDVTSYLVRDIIKKYGARIKEVEVGEMNVVKEIEKQKSRIGGEGSSGGVIIPPIKCRDGIMTLVLILKMMAERGKSLIEILESYPRYYSERTKVECSGDKLRRVKQGIEEHFKVKDYKIRKTGDYTGGLKIMFDKNSYVWFRPSKTEAGVFRIIADGDERAKVGRMLEQGVEAFNKVSGRK